MSVTAKGEWRPASKENALEFFEVPCRVDLWFYGSFGAQASVRDDDEDAAIAFELNPNNRERVIEALSNLLELMRSAK